MKKRKGLTEGFKCLDKREDLVFVEGVARGWDVKDCLVSKPTTGYVRTVHFWTGISMSDLVDGVSPCTYLHKCPQWMSHRVYIPFSSGVGMKIWRGEDAKILNHTRWGRSASLGWYHQGFEYCMARFPISTWYLAVVVQLRQPRCKDALHTVPGTSLN